jgi:hypothetical protein
MRTTEDIWREINAGDEEVGSAAWQVSSIANEVSYLHPKLAGDLAALSKKIEAGRMAVSGGHCELVNQSINASRDSNARLLCAAIEAAIR